MSGEKFQIFIVLALIFALLVAIFAISNAAVVNINFFGKIYSVSQALVILGCSVFGALAVAIIGLFARIKTAFKIRELKNKIKNLENELQGAKEHIVELEERFKKEKNINDNQQGV